MHDRICYCGAKTLCAMFFHVPCGLPSELNFGKNVVLQQVVLTSPSTFQLKQATSGEKENVPSLSLR